MVAHTTKPGVWSTRWPIVLLINYVNQIDWLQFASSYTSLAIHDFTVCSSCAWLTPAVHPPLIPWHCKGSVSPIGLYTVNSLMFTGINVCIFETKPCSWGLIFAVSLGLVSCLGTWIMFAGYLFLGFKDGCEICQINRLHTLMNLQYTKWVQ